MYFLSMINDIVREWGPFVSAGKDRYSWGRQPAVQQNITKDSECHLYSVTDKTT